MGLSVFVFLLSGSIAFSCFVQDNYNEQHNYNLEYKLIYHKCIYNQLQKSPKKPPHLGQSEIHRHCDSLAAIKLSKIKDK